MIWHEPSFITDPYRIDQGERPEYLVNTHKWKCEIDSRWTAEDSYRMFYQDHNLDGENFTQEKRIELAKLRALLDSNFPDSEKEKKL